MNARTLIVTSEAVPLMKTGGLADVISSLAHQLKTLGIDVSVLMPGYPAAVKAANNLREVGKLEQLPGGAGRLMQGTMPDTDVPVLLLCTDRFDRRLDNPYVDEQGMEFDDNAVCFGALAHVAAQICAGKTALPKPHVVHANDWHAALIPLLLKLDGIHDVGTIFTVHNLAFQGNFPLACASSLGIPSEMITADTFEFWGQMSFMKAGIRYADRISTVSRSYANEILTPRFGHGMDGILNTRKDELVAIPNGVDTDTWNPGSDESIARRFTLADLRGKSNCKRHLQQLFNLSAEPFAPVLAIGSRITHQKMSDVALAALPQILQQHPRAQVIVLGCGERRYEDGFRNLANQFPGRVGLHIGYDEKRAHALHAGADMLLHGSRFEPFGLTPIYSMRYGTIPIASRVGGMMDSIIGAGSGGAISDGASGILFDGEQPEEMVAAVNRAFDIYSRPSAWHIMQRNAMTADFSWEAPARLYIDAYRAVAAADAKHLFVASGGLAQSAARNYMSSLSSSQGGKAEIVSLSQSIQQVKPREAALKFSVNASSALVQ